MNGIAVIGGGFSGLAAVLRLRDSGYTGDITLFEASDRLGGLIATVRQDGFLIERGADSFITTKPAAVRLCERLGLADRLMSPNESFRRSLIVHDGQPVPTPDNFHLCVPRDVTAVLESPLLSTPGKLRFLAEASIPPGALGDESLASFCRRRFGQEMLDRIVQPITAGIYSADPEELSMAATMPQFAALERRHGSLIAAGTAAKRTETAEASGARYGLFATLPGGMQELVDVLTTAVKREADVRTMTPVHSISDTASGWIADVAGAVGDRGEARYQGVVLAAPARLATQMLRDRIAQLKSIRGATSAIVASGYRLDQFSHPLDAFGMVIPFVEFSPVTAVSIASRKFPGRAPDGCVLVRTFVGGPHAADALSSEPAMREAAEEALRRYLGLRGEPLTTLVTPYPEASPQYTLGHVERVDEIEREVSRLPGLALAGASYRGVGLPDAIASGETAADRVLATL